MSAREKLEYRCEEPGLWVIEGRQARRTVVRDRVNPWTTRTRARREWRVTFCGEFLFRADTLDEVFERIGEEVISR